MGKQTEGKLERTWVCLDIKEEREKKSGLMVYSFFFLLPISSCGVISHLFSFSLLKELYT
jgi:hypothetical protein